MNRYRIVPLAMVIAGVIACMGGKDVDTKPAEDKLKKGDLPAAATEYDTMAKEHADSVSVAIGQSYMQMLAGDFDAADKTLEAAQALTKDEKEIGEIKLRRALVALRAGNLDDVKKYGKESKLPAGMVLAAEVHLADAESDDAITLLKEARDADGPVGDTARTYLEMLESGDALQAGLAEATALWALGQRDIACEAAEELVKALPEDEKKSEMLLLWAGRAVTSGRPGVAQGLIDEMDLLGPPPGQEWRVQATKGMILIANEQYEDGVALFEVLTTSVTEGLAPYEGVADAKATAAGLCKDKEVAKTLTTGLESSAAARGLMEAGAGKAAKDAAPPGSSLASYLENN